jgi:hypothetical protein
VHGKSPTQTKSCLQSGLQATQHSAGCHIIQNRLRQKPTQR